MNQRETREAKFLQRQQLRLTYKVRFEDEPVHKLFLFGKSIYITPTLTRPIAIEMMLSNGAKEGDDYVIEEVEE